MKKLLIAAAMFVAPCLCHAGTADTIKIYFSLAVPALNAAAMHTIDSVIYYDILQPGKKIGIVGYADYVGSEQTNAGLSAARAENVKDYLVSMGIASRDIQTVIGKGEIDRPGMTSPEGYAADRRVDIIPGGIKADTTQPKTEKKEEPKIDISHLKKNETFVLDNIYFHPGSHKVKNESYPALRTLYKALKDNPTLKIQIEGHICCQPMGTTDALDYDNEEYHLSLNRAKEIYIIMKERGIDGERMKYMGFGMKKPLVFPETNATDENKNRRVEIRILEK